MTTIAAYQHGIYPRSEALVAATRDLDRDRTTEDAVDELFRLDQSDLVAAQREASLDYFSDGLLRWQDIFRPLIDACPGLRAGALVRWFDNNTFYRAPEVVGIEDLSLEKPSLSVLDQAQAVPEPRVASLPSPYLFSRVAVTTADRNDLMLDLAEGVLRPVAAHLSETGYGLIQLQEPWLAFHGIEDDAWKPFVESVGLVTDGLQATTVLHTFYGDAAPWADRLRDLPVDVVGFDFIETDLDALGSKWSQGILVGCVDGRRSLVEPVEDIVAFASRVAQALEPPDLYLSSAGDLELLSSPVAREKVLRLGEAARRLKEGTPG
jgi:5-methyltetrahydropteroyltriglutamate--homocysteine methyltransferase